MKNSEILAKIKGLGIALFGMIVFEQKELLAQNVTAPVKMSKNNTPFLDLRSESNPNEGSIIFLRRGVSATKASYDIAVFEANADASGKTQAGNDWSVAKGTKRVFAI